MNDLEKLFLSELMGVYDAEQQLVEALAEMESPAQAPELKSLFGEHLSQTKQHVGRLEQVFNELGEAPSRKTNHGITGILSESRGLLRQAACVPALIISTRKAEHYEISAYGSLCSWAKQLGRGTALELLKENLAEEKQADEKLNRIAEALPKTNPSDLMRLFVLQLREIYDGEHLLARALAELEYYAVSKVLKLAFRHHLKQTEKHFARLERVFQAMSSQVDRRRCKGIEGIIDDAQVLVLEFLDNPALDAALIAAGQKAEHYEISTYCSLCSWAKELGQHKVLDLLEANLSDERQTDQALTLLGETSRNREAARHDSPKKTQAEAALAKAITHGG